MIDTTVLKVDHVSFSYPRSPMILREISFEMKKGEILVILGPNGTGKTTLLRCILSLLNVQQGTITVEGKVLNRLTAKERSKYLAYVPQAQETVFDYTAFDMILLGRLRHYDTMRGATKKDCEVCDEVLERMGLTGLRDKYFNEMSGGERQMVLVARALVQEAKIIVLDEPTSSLDYKNQIKILHLLEDLRKQGYSILMTSHFPDQALLLKSRTLLLKDDVVYRFGPCEEVIQSEILSELYETPILVDVLEKNKHVRTCTPLLKKEL